MLLTNPTRLPQYHKMSIYNRFFCGATSLAFNTAVSVYRIELVSGKWRSRVSHVFGESFWHLGHLTLGLLAWAIPNMRYLELFIGLSAAPFMVFWFVLPESPRWLLTKGRKDEARKVVESACKVNKRPTDGVEDFIQGASGDASATDKKVRKREKTGFLKLKAKILYI